MNENFLPPTNNDAAYEMVAPLNPKYPDMFSQEEKQLAYTRLLDLIDLLFPE